MLQLQTVYNRAMIYISMYVLFLTIIMQPSVLYTLYTTVFLRLVYNFHKRKHNIYVIINQGDIWMGGGAYCFAFYKFKVTVCITWYLRLSKSAPDGTFLLIIQKYNYLTSLCWPSGYFLQDEEGRCYSDSFAELPERDPDEDLETSKQKE